MYVWCGAAAKEPDDYLQRDQYVRVHAQEAVLEQILSQVGDVGASTDPGQALCIEQDDTDVRTVRGEGIRRVHDARRTPERLARAEAGAS